MSTFSQISPNRKKRGGFTLIELLIAVVILSTVSVLAIQAFNEQFRISNEQRKEANLQVLNTAAERLSLTGDGRLVDNPDPNGNPIWVPDWPLLFADDVPSTDEESNAKAREVADYFIEIGLLSSHNKDSLNMDGIGYHISGYFMALDM